MPPKELFKTKESGRLNQRQKTIPQNFLAEFGRWLSGLLILLVRIYQITLRSIFPPSCRFHPSCSEYAISAFKRFGALKGGWLSVKRLSRCHPFNPGGYDPLP